MGQDTELSTRGEGDNRDGYPIWLGAEAAWEQSQREQPAEAVQGQQKPSPLRMRLMSEDPQAMVDGMFKDLPSADRKKLVGALIPGLTPAQILGELQWAKDKIQGEHAPIDLLVIALGARCQRLRGDDGN